ncbi:MAG: hypothetical protein U0R50_09150 [Gaiellales bacterium]
MKPPPFALVAELARREVRPGIPPVFALLIGCSAACGARLDPEVPDHAAVLEYARIKLEDDAELTAYEALRSGITAFTKGMSEVERMTSGECG